MVGNPPYVSVKDEAANKVYRDTYSEVCHRQYLLSVPFAQRFFQLSCSAGVDGRGAGYVGQITANAFMKREFGRKLIEGFLAHKIELTHVIDTSGAYIPGHGTPTVVLIGRSRDRNRTKTIRAVLGIRGEPTAPQEPANGLVWRAILSQLGTPGSESEWVSVADLPRQALATYPWSLSGGGAGDLLDKLEEAPERLAQLIEVVGRTTHTGLDDAYYMSENSAQTRGLGGATVFVVLGECLRDYEVTASPCTLFPYDQEGKRRDINHAEHKLYWKMRTPLRRRVDFGQSPEERGLRWYDHSMFFPKRYRTPLSIAFAFVATHNHFVLDRGGKVFNRTAPAVKLKVAEEEEHLQLLGVLNSSTGCFWLKQVSHNKGSTVDTRGARQSTVPWEDFYEFTGTKLREFPLPAAYPLELARELDGLAQRLAAVSPGSVATEATPTRERLSQAEAEWHRTRARMIALQEELDWQVYSLYGLLDQQLTAPPDAVPELRLGERAFEIVLARRMERGEAQTEWFARHGSQPLTELPGHWPAAYRALVERRIEVIESNRYLGLIERPEHKRRWATDGWDAMQAKALRDWLLDRCEARELWYQHVDGVAQPRPLSTAQLADALRPDPDVLAVADLYAPGKDLAKVIADLVADEHVPYLAALRYKPSGLAKRADWEQVWDMQREEDAAPDEPAKRKIRDRIPVPPKYSSADFAKPSYWRNRGKLDVPKERFISYPHAGKDSDASLLIGWAGWEHREQAQALAILIVEREQTNGWAADRLTPLLAGLREVLPWVRQWHGEFDPAIGDSPAAVYDGFLTDTANRLHLTDDDLASWRPPPRRRSG